MKISLRWKILAWALLNLALIAGAVVWFLHAQFEVGVHSLLAGPTGVRLDAVARQLAPDLVKTRENEWSAVMDTHLADWRARGVNATLAHNSGRVVSGDETALPAEVGEAIREHNRKFGRPPKAPGGMGGPPRGPGLPRGPENRFGPGGPDGFRGFVDDPPRDRGPDMRRGGVDPPPEKSTTSPTTKFEKFMLVSSNPRRYWAGVHLDNSAGPLPCTLLLSSDSIRGGGLFFDYVPWLVLGATLGVMSILLWLPLVHILTRTLENLTRSAENIAAGSFDAPPGTRRGDELGRLQNAHRHMAQRLDGFVTGQKRFLGDTAHELLSPLARLEVSLSILEQRAKEGERGTVERALGEVRRMADLVRELLAFSKTSLAHRDEVLEPVDVAEMIGNIVERERDGAVFENLVGGDLRVMALPGLLERALENVIRNAVRYAAADGPVRISAERAHGQVVIRVEDHGPGVPEEALPRLFDPFFRPDTSRTAATGGTGLGLAIVKTCVEACRGKVSAGNRAPRGFVVEITLGDAEP